ncbi:hypothetical protein C8F01DRAFT_1263568 [Mycena amicta]|nr:hypothetical protein C8F01DRAFT_1263568 [Mycena amicta]
MENEHPAFTPSAENVVGATFVTKDYQRLIQMQINIQGKTVNAIVDTGSMLNVVSRPAWRKYMSHISLDASKHINMGDTNGGQAQLHGYLKDVSLIAGGTESLASFWVGKHVPFEVLLGRPWQRGNFVSIDERRDGTYLVFRDPESGENRHELLVDDAEDPQNTSGSYMPGTFMNEVIKTQTIENLISEPQFNRHKTTDRLRLVRSVNCPPCQILLRADLMAEMPQIATDMGLGPRDYAAQLIRDHVPGWNIVEVMNTTPTAHTHFTDFHRHNANERFQPGANLQEVERQSSLMRLLRDNPLTVSTAVNTAFLNTEKKRQNIQAFLGLHPELIWLGTQERMKLWHFLSRISQLIEFYSTESATDLTVQSTVLALMGTNTDGFLEHFNHPSIANPEVSRQDAANIKELLMREPHLIAQAIQRLDTPQNFLLGILDRVHRLNTPTEAAAYTLLSLAMQPTVYLLSPPITPSAPANTPSIMAPDRYPSLLPLRLAEWCSDAV